jgi:spore coat polysaccharide biosynthesis protein SpsF
MKIVAILQARYDSSRQPGKVLLPMGDTTVLGQVLSRVRSAKRLHAAWVATSILPADDAIANEAARLGAPCFRGSSEDVLARYHDTAAAATADVIVRVTCDCPLFDGALLDEMLDNFERETAAGAPIDYMSNVIVRSYPRGLDAEIFTRSALEKAFIEASRTYDREHVTAYFYNNPEIFHLRNYAGTENLTKYRWTLDTPEDYTLIRSIFEILGEEGRPVTTAEVLSLMERRPELRLINAHIEQKKDALARANLP